MAVRVATITIKSANPLDLATFWRELLGYVEVEHPTTSIRLDDPTGAGPTLLVQPAERGDVGGPMHLDLRPDHRDASVERALRLGARRIDIGQRGDESWVVLADPDGNPFCMLQSLRDLDDRSGESRSHAT